MKAIPSATITPSRLEKTKSAISIARELLILIVIMICFFRPQTVPQWLCDAGFKEVKAFDISVAPECIIKRNVLAEVRNANVARQSKPIKQQIDQPVTASAVAVFKQAEVLAPETVPTIGWIYLGRVDSDSTRWEEGQPQTIAPVALPLTKGTQTVVRDAVYMRADVLKAESRSSGRIISAVDAGQRVEVLEVSLSSVKDERYLWAKVRLL
jgi:hypothetical protein